MKTGFFTKAATTTAAVATIAAGATFTNVETAEAGGKFWKGVGVGIVSGIVINEAVRHHRRHDRVVVVERAPRHVSSWDAHVSWCYDRYRSYSHRTNTYFIRVGVERVCRSPYY